MSDEGWGVEWWMAKLHHYANNSKSNKYKQYTKNILTVTNYEYKKKKKLFTNDTKYTLH